MTRKIYKSAMGKVVDLGALILENEHVRAVGNMNVNARGDVLNNNNKVIDSKNNQIQRQYKKQITTNTRETNVSSGTISSRRKKQQLEEINTPDNLEVIDTLEVIEEPIEIIAQPEPVTEEVATPIPRGGLAAALAKSQAVKQELMKTPRQLAQEKAGVKKI